MKGEKIAGRAIGRSKADDSDVEVKSGQIGQEMSYLENSVSSLESSLNDLELKLHPILTDVPEANEAESDREDEMVSLAYRIKSVRKLTNRLGDFVNRLRERAEL